MFPQHIRYNIFKHTIWVRWVVAGTIIPLTVLIHFFIEFIIQSETSQLKKQFISSFLLAFFVLFYNLIAIFFEKARKNNKTPLENPFLKTLFFLVYYFIFDAIAITWSVYNSGGSYSVILPLFFLILLFGAAIHSYRAALNIGFFCLIFLNLFFFLDQKGFINSIDLFYLEKYFVFSEIFKIFLIFTFDLVFAISIFVSVIISKTISEKEKLLTEERDKFQLLIENLKDGLIVLDTENRIMFVNKMTEQILGIERNLVLGKEVSVTMFEDPKFQNLGRVILIKEEATKGQFIPVEIQIQKPTPAIIRVYSVNIYDKGKLTAVTKILHDVSREKEIEKAKSEFISVAAHQLRTPLSALKWVFGMILGGDVGKITTEQKEMIEKGEFSTERMIDLVNDLLNVSRIEEGRFGYELKEINLRTVIEKLIAMEENKIKEKNINLIFEKPREGMRLVKADEEKLFLAFQNLMENAINYSLKNGEITVSLKDDKTNLITEIKDNGIGIPKEQMGKLFSKFFRGNNAVKLQTEGSGLGLFIAKNIVEKHGGKIIIESEEGNGTKATVFLPRLESDAPEEKFKEFLQTPSPKKEFKKFIQKF